MIIIPEIETVVILVPRAGSTSLISSLTSRYPKAMLIYRHMEADGIPDGYERWRKVGIVRDPLERLWSLYWFLKTFDGKYSAEYIKSQRDSVDCSFSDFVLYNKTVFTSPYDSTGGLNFYPQYNVKHSMPENIKSQWHCLRPDLGTEIFQFTELKQFGESLGVSLLKLNTSITPVNESLTAEKNIDAIIEHMERWFKWDIEVTKPWWQN